MRIPTLEPDSHLHQQIAAKGPEQETKNEDEKSESQGVTALHEILGKESEVSRDVGGQRIDG